MQHIYELNDSLNHKHHFSFTLSEASNNLIFVGLTAHKLVSL